MTTGLPAVHEVTEGKVTDDDIVRVLCTVDSSRLVPSKQWLHLRTEVLRWVILRVPPKVLEA